MVCKGLVQVPPQVQHLLRILLIRRDIPARGAAISIGSHHGVLRQQRLRRLPTAESSQICRVGRVAGTKTCLVDIMMDGEIGVWWIRVRKVHLRLGHGPPSKAAVRDELWAQDSCGSDDGSFVDCADRSPTIEQPGAMFVVIQVDGCGRGLTQHILIIRPQPICCVQCSAALKSVWL